MASDCEFVHFAAEQLREAGEIVCRKMFGEYGLYCDGKFIGVICENQVFVKITEAVKAAYPGLPEAPPYAGAKPYFLLEDIDDSALAVEIVRKTYAALPENNKKKTAKKS